MTDDHLKLEFDRGRFPLRFLLANGLALLLVWVTLYTLRSNLPPSLEALLAHVGLVACFAAVSLAFLKFFNEDIARLPSIYGMLMGWGITLIVAVALHLITYLTNDQPGDAWSLPYLRHIHAETTQLLLLLTALIGLPFFWIEREVFSVRALVRSTEMTQFSNLGFRIRPHFLFNTLNSVAHLISLHPARAEKALYNLADVFRVVMADKRELVPMKAELELADKYLYLEKTRLGERLQVTSRIDPESLGIMVPVLMLQPLLENAVYHGIETRFKGGTINISVQVVEKQLIIQIMNPLPEGSIKRNSGNRVAQDNLRDRIYRTFGTRGTFDAHEADERYTVTIRLPL